MNKKELRQKLYRKRSQAYKADQTLFEGADVSEAAATQLVDMAAALIEQSIDDKDIPSTVIAGYIPIGSEIDPRPLMNAFHEQGALLCVPEVVALDAPLIFRQWKPGDLLISGPLGTLQPLSTAPILVPDLMFLPLVGVDASGVRLGQGGGFYDRTIENLRPQGMLTYGLAFDEQMVDEIPQESHDQLLDGLISPSVCKRWGDDRVVRYIKQL